MKMKMRKCSNCNYYTLKDNCPNCGGSLNVVYPPKYSLEDRYGEYRRKLKKEQLEKNMEN